MKAKFLNVDLEIKSSERPEEIEKEFEEAGASILFSDEVGDGYLSTFEVNSNRDAPDQVILDFSRLIEGFGEKAKNEWKEAKERIFDVGYEANETIQNTLKEETIRIIADLEGIARYTTYETTDAN